VTVVLEKFKLIALEVMLQVFLRQKTCKFRAGNGVENNYFPYSTRFMYFQWLFRVHFKLFHEKAFSSVFELLRRDMAIPVNKLEH
jgi:hypothetical protein